MVSLENIIESHNQYQMKTCVNISGVSETQNEDTDQIVVALAKEMNLDISPNDISNSHRLPSRVKTKTKRDIVVRFISYRKRSAFYKLRTKLKNSSKFKNVFINDHLTQQRQKHLYECCQAKRRKQLKDAWSYEGKNLGKDINSKW
jgi:hypothetical protein